MEVRGASKLSAMAASTTSQVYIQVIEDVMNKVRDEFVNNGGPGEEVLKELQAVIYPNIFSLPEFISFFLLFFIY